MNTCVVGDKKSYLLHDIKILRNGTACTQNFIHQQLNNFFASLRSVYNMNLANKLCTYYWHIISLEKLKGGDDNEL